MPQLRTLPVLFTGLVLVAGCTAGPPAAPPTTAPTPTPTATPDPTRARTVLPASDTVVVPGTGAAELAVATSRALFASAPAVVLVADGDTASLSRATQTAVRLGVPLLLTPRPTGPSTSASPNAAAQDHAAAQGGAAEGAAAAGARVRAEIDRLAPRTLVTVGPAAASWAVDTPTPAPGVTNPPPAVIGDDADGTGVADVQPPAPLDQVLTLALDGAVATAAAATARAAGTRVLTVADPDPRASADAITALAAQSTATVVALGSAFGPADRLRDRVNAAATGVQLPGGGQVVFPGRRMVALYGHPGDTILGSLGEQGLEATVARAKKVAGGYTALFKEPVVPAFEIIATVASASAGSDGNYTNEGSPERLRPWIAAAQKAGIYVVLDLQPGRTDFLTQAKLFTDLLLQPNVGLALDPEWRLKPNQVPNVQIGSVDASEINRTAVWLAELTRSHALPQKLLMVHQFRLDMITNRSTLRTDLDELRVVIHADGFGTAGQKANTWNALHLAPPANVLWGWKNFYDEDKPTFTPQQTVAVRPAPVFISYQ